MGEAGANEAHAEDGIERADVHTRIDDAHGGVERRRCGEPRIDIAIPFYGYKNHVSIDRRHGIIRRFLTTDAAAHDGARLRQGLVDSTNTASDVWADTAYRSAANEAWLARHGKVSRIHRRKPMPEAMSRANGMKSKVRARVEHVFAEQKDRMGLFTVALAPSSIDGQAQQGSDQHRARHAQGVRHPHWWRKEHPVCPPCT
jgi:hypothetical protein